MDGWKIKKNHHHFLFCFDVVFKINKKIKIKLFSIFIKRRFSCFCLKFYYDDDDEDGCNDD